MRRRGARPPLGITCSSPACTDASALARPPQVVVCTPETSPRSGKISELFVYDNFSRSATDSVDAGDICAVVGLADASIGETICLPDSPNPLPTIKVEEPTVRMTFMVNNSPFAGREGKFVTSRNIKDRLDRELERNLALRVEPGETADQFIVSGRGALHLGEWPLPSITLAPMAASIQ